MSHHREKEKLKAQNAESEETLTSKTVTEARQGNIEIHSATSTETPSEKGDSKEKSLEPIETDYIEKMNQLEDRYLRLAAEFDNFKKRTARQIEEIIKTSNENILIQILEVMDNFQRALEVAKSATDFDSLHRGTELINQHLSDILKKEGIKKIQVVGQKFDPHLHEAVMKVESDEYPDGMIAEEIAAGYMLNGKIIRHSKVAVSGGKMEAAKDNADE